MTAHKLILSALLTMGLMTAPALSETPEDAEAFVQTNGQEILELLGSYKSGEINYEELQSVFRQRLEDLADVERVTNFVLGRYRRIGDPDEVAEFREVFRDYAIASYEQELNNYAGHELRVVGVTTRNDDDFIVHSEFIGPVETHEVNWRILQSDGELQVVDVEVAGVWLAQTQREQITSIIGNNGGRVSAATEELRSLMAS